MAVGANSYGSAADVAALCRVYTISGSFTTATNPTLVSVESFIDQISAIANTSLAAQGFNVPITQTDGKLAVSSMVVQIVSDMAHAANSAGRFFSERALEGGWSIMATIRKDINAWVAENAAGLDALGCSRKNDSQMTVGYRDDGYEPLFTRDQYGSDTE